MGVQHISSRSRLTKLLNFGIAVVLVLLPFHAFFTTWLGANFDHLNLFKIWKEIIIFGLAPVAVWAAWRQPELRRWLWNSWFIRLYGLYILLHLGLGFWALHDHQVNGQALIDGLLTNLRFFGFFLVCLVASALDPWLRRVWPKLVLVPAAIVLTFGWLQRFILPLNFLSHFGYSKATIPAYQTVDAQSSLQRIQSTLRGANPFGAYLTLVIPAWWGTINRWPWRVLGTGFGLVALWFSYSRSAWVGTALALAILVWWAAGRRQRRWLLTGSLIAVVVVGAGLYVGRNNSRLQDTVFHHSQISPSAKSSNQVRARALRAGWHDLVHQPFGRGPGTAGPASEHNNHHARIAEDYYIQIGQEVGFEGIIIFLALVSMTVWWLWQARSDPLARILLASLVGISLINLVSHAWADDTLGLLWWGLAGIALGPVIIRTKAEHEKH